MEDITRKKMGILELSEHCSNTMGTSDGAWRVVGVKSLRGKGYLVRMMKIRDGVQGVWDLDVVDEGGGAPLVPGVM